MATFTNQGSALNNYIYSGGGNASTAEQLQVGEPNDAASVTRRTLLKWDLSSIPTNAVVSSATLSLWSFDDKSSNTRTWSVYRVLRDWVESESTWEIYSTGNNWGTAGCSNTTSDREATDIGTVSIAGDRALGEIQISLTAAKVQEWISGAQSNFGMLIQAATETDDMWGMRSTQYATSGERPKLVIEYTVPSSGFFAIL